MPPKIYSVRPHRSPTSVSTPYRSRVCTCNPQRDSNNGGLMGIVLDLNRERDNVGIVKPHPHHNDDDSPKKRSGPYWHKRHSHSPHTIVSSHTPPPSTILRPKSEVSRSTLLITNMNMGIISCRFASRSNECFRAHIPSMASTSNFIQFLAIYNYCADTILLSCCLIIMCSFLAKTCFFSIFIFSSGDYYRSIIYSI